MLNDYVIGHFRTFVPVWVGAALAWLSDTWGITDIDTAATAFVVTGIITSAYYALVRAVAEAVPWVGNLLGPGTNKAPTYNA